MSEYADILNVVVDNGRVSSSSKERGRFDRESLIVEVEFEAGERGLSDDEIKSAVQFALKHAKHD